MALDTPNLLVPTFTLANAIPGTANFISPFPDGSNAKTFFTMIRLIGYGGGSNVTANLVPGGGSAANSNIEIPQLLVLYTETVELYWDMNYPFIVPAGYSFYIFCSVANATNCSIHGYHIS